MKKIFWQFFSISILCLCFGMAGCSTALQATVSLNQKSEKAMIEPDHGLLVFKTLVPKVNTRLVPNWQIAVITNTVTKQDFVLKPVHRWFEPFALFVGAVPSGTYAVTFLGSVEAMGQNNLRLGQKYAFKVASGRISDLGTLVTAVGKWVSINQSEVLTFQTRSEFESRQIEARIQSKFPTLISMAENDIWTVNTGALRNVDLATSQGVSRRFYSPKVSKVGVSYTGEEMGQVRMLSQTGVQSWLNTGLTNEISALCLLEDGKIVVGSADGLVLSKSSHSTKWMPHPLPVPDAVVESIAQIKGKLYAAVISGSDLILFSTTLGLTNQWTEIARTPLREETFFGRFSSTKREIAISDDGLSLVEWSAGFISKGTLSFFDFGKTEWFTSPVVSNGHGNQIGLMALAADGAIAQIRGTNEPSQLVSVSTDHGKTWRDSAPLGHIVFLSVISNREMYALRRDHVKMEASRTGGIAQVSQFSLWRTADGGEIWSKMSDTKSEFKRLFELNPKTLVGITTLDEVYTSTDQGATWISLDSSLVD